MDELKVNELLGEYAGKAKDLLSEEGKVEEVLEAAEKTLSEIPTIGDKVAKLPLMFSMIRSYVTKEYTDVSPKVVASMVGAFLYLISRKDLIPDKIPVIGMADDVGILALAIKLNENELNTYSAWRESRKAEKED
jgi:uncharacterized membrane protein YkvA (DUF1232 family)